MGMSRTAPSMSARPDVVNPPADALGAALALVGAGWGVFPAKVIGKKKQPIRGAWQHPATGAVVAALSDDERRKGAGYTTDADTVRTWWGPGGRYAGCDVGIALRDAGAFAIDLDDDVAAAGWAAMVEAGGGIAPTFTVHSAKGAKVLLRRDGSPVPRGANGNRVRPEDGPWPFAGRTDVIGGNVIAWSEGRRWEGSPAVVATCPEWLHAPLSAVYAPPQPASPPAATAPTTATTTAPAMPWGRSSDPRAVLTNLCAAIAGMGPDSGRNAALSRAAFTIGGMIHLQPNIAAEAERDLIEAARACGELAEEPVKTLGTIRRGIADGQAQPLRPRARVHEDERDDDPVVVRAAAVAELGRLRPNLDVLAHLHHKRRVTVCRLVGALLATVAETGRRRVFATLDDIAPTIDVGRKAIAAAAADLAALGWTWQPGDAAERRAGCWTWAPSLSVAMTHGGGGSEADEDGNTGVNMTESPAVSVAVPVGVRPDVLPLALRRPVLRMPDGTRRRALRRRSGDAPTVPRPGDPDRLDACGAWVAEAIAVVRAAPDGAEAEDVEHALGVSNRIARRALANAYERDILTRTTAPTTGRPRFVYHYAPADVALATEVVVGLLVYARAVASAEARADRAREARAEAAETGESVRMVLSRNRGEDARRRRAERQPMAERYPRPVVVPFTDAPTGYEFVPPAAHTAEYWQDVDAATAARMPELWPPALVAPTVQTALPAARSEFVQLDERATAGSYLAALAL